MRRASSQSRGSGIWIIPAVVGVLAAAPFLPALANGFVAWDDDRNFLENLHYRGLGLDQLRWMWTTFHMGHYVPLSWMTLGLDYELWGMDARGYHFTSIVLHALNAVLLFWIARRLLSRAFDERLATRTIELAAAAGALFFAMHPLRVESVVWITERRDVLSGVFCSAALLSYLRSIDSSGAHPRRQYGLSLALFAAALLSKATSTTLPAVMAILNVYPLRRLGGSVGWRSAAAQRVYRELTPFVILAVAVVPLTLRALAPPDQLHTVGKLAVSAYSLAFYVWKTVLPTGLSPLYPMPAHVDAGAMRFVLAAVFVIALAFTTWFARRRSPAILASALAFLVMVLPMLGVVQNGPLIAADRYTYHSAPALALLSAGLMAVLLARGRMLIATAAAAAVLGTFGIMSARQTTIWHDSASLWSYVAAHDSTSVIAQTALGTIDLQAGRFDAAEARYRRAISLDSSYAEAHDNLGVALSRQGRFAEATEHYRAALALAPSKRETHNNLGVADARLGRYDEAIAEYSEAVELDPDYADAQTNWGNVLLRLGRLDDAIVHYQAALRAQPANADAQHNWGVALAQAGRLPEAIEHVRAALAANPSHAEARAYLDQALEIIQTGGARSPALATTR
jgi:tetratricopeptide (TPR) repeat protein